MLGGSAQVETLKRPPRDLTSGTAASTGAVFVSQAGIRREPGYPDRKVLESFGTVQRPNMKDAFAGLCQKCARRRGPIGSTAKFRVGPKAEAGRFYIDPRPLALVVFVEPDGPRQLLTQQ